MRQSASLLASICFEQHICVQIKQSVFLWAALLLPTSSWPAFLSAESSLPLNKEENTNGGASVPCHCFYSGVRINDAVPFSDPVLWEGHNSSQWCLFFPLSGHWMCTQLPHAVITISLSKASGISDTQSAALHRCYSGTRSLFAAHWQIDSLLMCTRKRNLHNPQEQSKKIQYMALD